eukprot:2404328-Amphidinium_carterae.1
MNRSIGFRSGVAGRSRPLVWKHRWEPLNNRVFLRTPSYKVLLSHPRIRECEMAQMGLDEYHRDCDSFLRYPLGGAVFVTHKFVVATTLSSMMDVP